MTTHKKLVFTFKIIIKCLLLFFGVWGVSAAVFGNGFMGNGSALLYFTMQSNITIMLITLVFLISDIKELTTGIGFINNGFRIVKFVFTVAITITFIVFFVLLAPRQSASYLVSMSNLTVHLLVPILAIIDMFLFDYVVTFKRKNQLAALLMPIYYLIFSLSLSFIGISFNGNVVPYFFLDYTKLGWFGISDGLGVVYWIIIFIIGVTGLSFLMSYLLGIVKKSREKN